MAFKGRAGQLWRSVNAAYELDPAEKQLLGEACATLAELERVEQELSEAPLIVAGSTGQPVPHPLLATAQHHRQLLERLLRALALPVPGETTGTNRTPTQRRAAKTQPRLRKVSNGDDT